MKQQTNKQFNPHFKGPITAIRLTMSLTINDNWTKTSYRPRLGTKNCNRSLNKKRLHHSGLNNLKQNAIALPVTTTHILINKSNFASKSLIYHLPLFTISKLTLPLRFNYSVSHYPLMFKIDPSVFQPIILNTCQQQVNT